MIGINLFLLSDFVEIQEVLSKYAESASKYGIQGLCRVPKAHPCNHGGQDCFSNRAFAERTGVSLPVIARAALFGIVPTTRALIKIADALELSFSYLLEVRRKMNLSLPRRPLRLPRGWKNCAKNGR